MNSTQKSKELVNFYEAVIFVCQSARLPGLPDLRSREAGGGGGGGRSLVIIDWFSYKVTIIG